MTEAQGRFVSPSVGIVAAIFSAASFLLSGFLFTYCVPVVVEGNSVGCIIPHQLAATGFLLLGVVLFVLSVFLVIGNNPRVLTTDARPDSGTPPPGLASPGAGIGEGRVYLPVTVRTKCQFCGIWSPAGSVTCRDCDRPLAWSNPG